MKAAWVDEQRAISRGKMYEAMRARYRVVLPAIPVKLATGSGPAAVSLR